MFFANHEPVVEETDGRGMSVIFCLFILVILNCTGCCEVSCCTLDMFIEHLTIWESLTFDWFSFSTLAF